MEAHRLGLGGAVQCGALAGRMQDAFAASGKQQEREAQPPALPEAACCMAAVQLQARCLCSGS